MSELENKGVLYVCGTPIGNLNDITFRLKEVLEQCDIVACEDTRRTFKLLSHLGLKKRLFSVHEHVEKQRLHSIIKFLSEGSSVALVTDAGMPLISDPGAEIVNGVRREGYRVVAIPGPSAVTTALALSGFPSDRFVFGGFPPRKSSERRQFYQDWIKPEITAVFYEAPHRLKSSLADMSELFPGLLVCLCHEMTKIHEEILSGTVEEIVQALADRSVQGEWVIVCRVS